jgi:hypothetical protein
MEQDHAKSETLVNATRASATARANRRWLRFSLRGLLLIVAIFCVWLGIKVNAARRQAEAVAAILKAGGTVNFDYQMIPAKSGEWTCQSRETCAVNRGLMTSLTRY